MRANRKQSAVSYSANPNSGGRLNIGFGLSALVVAFALIGPGVSYSSVYVFHVLVLVWLSYSAAAWFVEPWRRIAIRGEMRWLFTVLVLVLITGVLASDIWIYLEHAAYVLLGFSVIVATYVLSVRSRRKCVLGPAFSIPFIAVLILGVAESLGLFRYPLSVYSDLRPLFGYSNIWSDPGVGVMLLGRHLEIPTTFYGNPNDLGFFLMLTLPFVVVVSRGMFRAVSLLTVLWLLLMIGSRAQFMSLLALMLLMVVVTRPHRGGVYLVWAIGAGLIGIGYFLFGFGDLSVPSLDRMLSAFRDVGYGVELLFSGDMDEGGSTATRASIYAIGLQEYVQSAGLGIGLGGTRSALEQWEFRITSFHFFFLQLLVELGPVFLVVMGFYIILSVGLIRKGRRAFESQTGRVAVACGSSLLIAIPSSIAPSGVYYFLPFYVLLGLSLASWSRLRRVG